MTPFPPHRLTFVYRPGSGKVLVNLLRFSSTKIPLVFLQQCTISAEERCRYLALDPHLVFTTKQDEALAASSDAILWAREVFETEQDFLCWRELMEQAIAHRKNIYNLARLNLIATDPDLSRLASQNQIKYWEASTAANEIARRPTYGQIVPKRPKANLITQLAPREARQGRRVVHRYQSCHGTSRDPVSERPLPIRVPAALRHRGTMRGSSGENSLA